MNILLLAPQPFFQNRGTPIAVRMLAEELGRAGYTVELLVFHEGEDVELANVIVHRTRRMPGLDNIGPGFSIKKLIGDLLMTCKSLSLCRKKSIMLSMRLKRLSTSLYCSRLSIKSLISMILILG